MLELAVTLGGSLVGFVMKMMANRAERDAQLFERALKLSDKNKESHDAAARRDGRTGKFVRRMIVMAVLFMLTVVPFIAPLLGIPVITQTEEGWSLFGLISGTDTTFTYVYGVLLVPEIRTVLLSIVGFYFGTAAAVGRR